MRVAVVNKGETPPADAGFIVGSNGSFISINNGWVSAVVPVTSVPLLEKIEKQATYLLPRIPVAVLAEVLALFRHVDNKLQSEVAVMLHHGPEGWLVTCPDQEVSAGTVSYEMTDRVAGYRCVGTMHSHVRMAAFHSGVDESDEKVFDGVHITIGHIDELPAFDCDVELRVRGARFKLKPEQVFEDVEPNGKKKGWKQTSTRLTPDAEGLLQDGFPPEWYERVKKRKWTSWGGESYSGSSNFVDWVVHLEGEPPGRFNYDGPEWDEMDFPTSNPGFHYTKGAAERIAEKLSKVSGRAFDVSERPTLQKSGRAVA